MTREVSVAFEGRTLVLGLGATGYSVVRFLRRHDVDVQVLDTRLQPTRANRLSVDFPDVELYLGKHDLDQLPAFNRIVISPGISPQEVIAQDAASKGIPVIGDIEIFARFADHPVLAVTGSNGKSTVATLAAELCRVGGLKTLLGGNIGTPALDLFSIHDAELYVLELSSFQLDTTHSLKAKGGVILNISEDHLDRYRDMVSYVNSKCRLGEMAQKLIVNRNDPYAKNILPLHKKLVTIGLDKAPTDRDYGLMNVAGEEYIARGEKRILRSTELSLLGRHNQLNAMAACALADIAGVESEQYQPALRSFPGLQHRCELIPTTDGRTWVNDSKGTNVGATLAALDGFDVPIILIAGGQAKGADFTALGALAGKRYKYLVLIGQDAALLAGAVAAPCPIYFADSLGDAVQQANSQSAAGDTILFSPACASFDMFRNYEHRGDCFRQSVKELGNE